MWCRPWPRAGPGPTLALIPSNFWQCSSKDSTIRSSSGEIKFFSATVLLGLGVELGCLLSVG